MHPLNFLQDLAIVMIVAAVVTGLFHRLKQPVVLGYILAGVIIGPHTPPIQWIAEADTIQTLSVLGVIFLMFSLGLEFSLRKLRAVGATALIAATLEILVMVFAGYQVGRLFGWGTMDSIFLGAILSISSTTIILKALEELGKTKEKFAGLIFGILIVEDILAIVMLALLSGFAVTGALDAGDVAATIGKLGAFLAALLVVGLIFVPRLLNYLAKFKSDEMLLVVAVGLCFGVSLLASKLGYSVALGAFLIGAIVAESRPIHRIETLMRPVRDVFSAVFFVSIGLLIDPAMLVKYATPILVITAVVIVGQVAACTVGTFVAGNDRNTSLKVGMGLAQIGEFSYIIAALGLSLKVTSDFLYPIIVAVSVLTTLTTPYLIRSSDALVSWFDRSAPAPMRDFLDSYTNWMSRPSPDGRRAFGWTLLRKWLWQMILNLALMAAVFIATATVQGYALAWWPDVPGGANGMKALLWLGAMVVSLPMLIAVLRKLQAAGILVGELSVARSAAGEKTDALRAVVANTVLVTGCVAIGLLTLLLSSALLPSWNVLVVVALVLVVLVVVLRRAFIRLHARAQGALAQTLAEEPVPRAEVEPARTLPAMLRAAELRPVSLDAKSSAAGKMIAELALRTRTGASIVGIDRAGVNIINPGPDEELQAGDVLLLLGTTEQLDRALPALKDGTASAR